MSVRNSKHIQNDDSCNEDSHQTTVIIQRRYSSQKKSIKSTQMSQYNINNSINERISKIQAKLEQQKKDEVKMILTFLILLFVSYFFISYQDFKQIKKYGQRLFKLEEQALKWQTQVLHLEHTVAILREQLEESNNKIQKMTGIILDIVDNELAKPQKSMSFLEKYSSPIQLELNTHQRSFKKNYKYSKQQSSLRKTSQQEVLAYASHPVQSGTISYFRVKIEEIQLGMISIGLFTQTKLETKLDCGYCQGNQMYYLYCKDGYIYHGQNFIQTKSKSTRMDKVNKDDIVTVFIDRQQDQIIWYVNGKYLETSYIEKEDDLYPFILMTTRGDQVTILTT